MTWQKCPVENVRTLRRAPFDSLAVPTTEEEIEKEISAHFFSFCKELKLQVLPVNDIKITQILDDYFEQKPPFKSGKKKAEFPDAIAAYALKRWCMANSQRMYVVTGDTDWQDICEPQSPLVLSQARSSEMFCTLVHECDLATTKDRIKIIPEQVA